MESMKAFGGWFMYTSRIVGAPILAFLIVWGIQKLTYTGTCVIASLKCEKAIGADDSMVAYMGDLLAANPGNDIVVKPKK